MDTWIEEGIEKLEAEHGSVPPPWAIINEHPLNICWRMGGGEGHLILWREWWECQGLNVEERIEYFRKWPPPHCWLEFLIEAIWDVDLEDHESDDETDYFKLTEDLGFGGYEDYRAEFHDQEKWLR